VISSLVKRQAITIAGKTDTRYIVAHGLKVGDKIVTEGLGTLSEGTKITPQSSGK
jgi:membrane fusion protein (multidrug efflux system)